MEQRSGTVPDGPVTRLEPSYCTATLSLAGGQVEVTEKSLPGQFEARRCWGGVLGFVPFDGLKGTRIKSRSQTSRKQFL